MNLNDNPIFLTQKRLVHRGGVLAAILIAALVGLSLLSGLIAYLADPADFSSFKSPQDAGKVFYGWTVGMEILVLVVGGAGRIALALGNDRKAGLWDSNRLTPLKSSRLVMGYWLGSPLREFYMAVLLAGIGLVIVLLGGLSPMLWLGTQILILSTALFFGLIAVLGGMVAERPQNGLAPLALFFFLQLPSFAAPRFLLTNFLVPAFALVNLFTGNSPNTHSIDEWNGLPEIFGLPIHPILLSLILQAIIGIFFWRAAIRKAANHTKPLLLRWEIVALLGILLVAQHGLIWSIWSGRFPEMVNYYANSDFNVLLPVVHGGTLLLAVVLLGLTSPSPESIRVKAMRIGAKRFREIFSHTALLPALTLTAVAAAVLLTQCVHSLDNAWENYLIAVGNLLSFSLIFALLLEFCRLRYRRRAVGFLALWLFILCILPFILATVFVSSEIAKVSLLAPGVVALANPAHENLGHLLSIVAAHLGIALLLTIAWQRQWRLLLAPQSAPPAGQIPA